MKAERPKLRLLLDAGVPDSVGHTFEEFGHHVVYHRDALPEKTKDVVVCATALANDAILVAVDNDMKQIAKSFGVGNDRFKRLSLIKFHCSEVMAAKRLRQAMSLIEHEWNVSEEKRARRLWIDIGAHFLRSHR